MNDIYDKIQAILHWADDEGSNFDDDFVLEMSVIIETGRKLTPAQEQAIDRIVDAYRIDVDYWK